jgi:hypothetical protein
MGHGMTARQGVGPRNGLREQDDVEAEAHRCCDGAAGKVGLQWLGEQLRALVKLLDLHMRMESG